MLQYLTESGFWMHVGVVAGILLIGYAVYALGKKPSRSQRIYWCHREFVDLQKKLAAEKFIDYEQWLDKIETFKSKWQDKADNSILYSYVDYLRESLRVFRSGSEMNVV